MDALGILTLRPAIAGALALSVSLFVLLGLALWQPGCATLVPPIPMAECDARCGTEAAEDASRELALQACAELTAAELAEWITPERCRTTAVVLNSCRSRCTTGADPRAR